MGNITHTQQEAVIKQNNLKYSEPELPIACEIENHQIYLT